MLNLRLLRALVSIREWSSYGNGFTIRVASEAGPKERASGGSSNQFFPLNMPLIICLLFRAEPLRVLPFFGGKQNAFQGKVAK